MKEISRQNCRGQAEDLICSRTAPPGICMVNNIIVEQGCNMQVFKGNGQRGDLFFASGAEAGSKNAK